jgi:outer membrane autotransporter protein
VYGDWSVWTEGQIRLGKVDATSTSSAQDTDSFLVTLGADRPYGDKGLFGMAVAFGKDDVDIGNVGSGMESDNYGFSLYVAYQPENLMPMEATLGVGHMQMDNTRIDGAQTLTGSRDGNLLFGSLSVLGETFARNDFALTPYGRFEAAYIELDGYTETGGSLALVYDKQTIERFMVFAGSDMSYKAPVMGGTLRPFGKVEYGVDLSGTSDVDMHYVGDTRNYTLGMDKLATSHWTLGIGADFDIKDGLSSTISYERSEAVSAGHADTFRLKLNLPF